MNKEGLNNDDQPIKIDGYTIHKSPGYIAAQNASIPTTMSPEEMKRIYNQTGIIYRSGKTFKEELTSLINRHSIEKGSNTPDFILAEYLCGCLAQYEATMSLLSLHGSMVSITDDNHKSI